MSILQTLQMDAITEDDGDDDDDEEQSDQGLHFYPFNPHFVKTFFIGRVLCLNFRY